MRPLFHHRAWQLQCRPTPIMRATLFKILYGTSTPPLDGRSVVFSGNHEMIRSIQSPCNIESFLPPGGFLQTLAPDDYRSIFFSFFHLLIMKHGDSATFIPKIAKVVSNPHRNLKRRRQTGCTKTPTGDAQTAVEMQ